MENIAFLFPGQGSQREGMGIDLFENISFARERFAQAEAILGWSVEDLCRSNPENRLGVTLYTQPALYTVCAVMAETLMTDGLEPICVAGHSAGEYAALTAAKAWDFQTGLRVIAERARLMHEMSQKGAMAAVLGLDPNVIAVACASWTDGIVAPANFNSPKQTVITGEKQAVLAISPILKEMGAKRVVPLAVSGAFHSPLMREARALFEEFLADVPLSEPKANFVSNNTGAIENDVELIRRQLVGQFCEPVRWVDCMKTLASRCDAAMEIGPGNVLTGLARQCEPELTCYSTDSIEGMDQIKKHVVIST